MKIFTTILMVLAVLLIGVNVTQLNPSSLFSGNSLIALIGIVAAVCALLMLMIFRYSKQIEEKLKG